MPSETGASGRALTERRALCAAAPSLLSPQRGSAATGEKTESLTQGCCTGRGGGASQFQEETRRNQEIRSPIPAAGQETSGGHVFASEKTKTNQQTSRFSLRRHRGERLRYLEGHFRSLAKLSKFPVATFEKHAAAAAAATADPSSQSRERRIAIPLETEGKRSNVIMHLRWH